MGAPVSELQPSREERSIAYSDAWKDVLSWRQTFSAEVDQPILKRVKTLSLLTPSQQMIAEMQPDSKKHLELEMLPFVTQAIAQYVSSSALASYVPTDIQIILYPQHRDGELFPEHGKRAGFHLRRGGYPVMLIPMRQKEDGSYGLQPLIIGHELGEIAVSHMLRNLTGAIGTMANLEDHPLKEGFCEACGLDFYRFLAEKQGKQFNLTYDYICQEAYKKHDLRRLLGKIPCDQAAEDEQTFMRYLLSGSIVSKLIETYGFEKVLKYFADEADSIRKKDEKFRLAFEKLTEATGGLIKVTLRTEKTATPPNKKELNDLLKQLGYKPEQFLSLDSSTQAVDNKPEGAVAALIVDQFYDWFNRDEPGVTLPERLKTEDVHKPTGKDQLERPSFIQRVLNGINRESAAKIFGEDFSAETFIQKWKDDFLSRNTAETQR